MNDVPPGYENHHALDLYISAVGSAVAFYINDDNPSVGRLTFCGNVGSTTLRLLYEERANQIHECFGVGEAYPWHELVLGNHKLLVGGRPNNKPGSRKKSRCKLTLLAPRGVAVRRWHD